MLYTQMFKMLLGVCVWHIIKEDQVKFPVIGEEVPVQILQSRVYPKLPQSMDNSVAAAGLKQGGPGT